MLIFALYADFCFCIVFGVDDMNFNDNAVKADGAVGVTDNTSEDDAMR